MTATVFNGTAGIIYVGRDVPFSRQNDVGYSSRKNRFVNSNNINAGGWNPLNITPTFTNGYTVIRETSATGEHRFFSSYSRTAGQRQTVNVWVKPDGRSRIVIADSANGVYYASFNLITQTVSAITGTGGSITTSIVPDDYYGEGGYRCTIKYTDVGEPPASTSARTVMVRLVNDAGITTYAGDTNLGIILYNIELQDGDVEPSYQTIKDSPGASVLFPAIINSTTSAAGDVLQFTGKAPVNAQVENSNCLKLYGVDDYIEMDLKSIGGDELVNNGNFDININGWTNGTGASSSWSSGEILITGGSQFGTYQVLNLVVGKQYIITGIGRVGTAANIRIRATTDSGLSTVIAESNIVESASNTNMSLVFTATATNNTVYLRVNAEGLTGYFDSISVRELPPITNQGTSFLSYRQQADGITGTFGTVYDIKLGDKCWITCSEGTGNRVHDVIRNLPYFIINYQNSNWEEKQNTFHYNLIFGHNYTDTFYGSWLFFNSEQSGHLLTAGVL